MHMLSERLDRLRAVMAGYVERGELPGLVTLVSRRGEVCVDAFGQQAVGDAVPMRRDTIFRISSMTKPITAVAALILVEEGKLELDGPVDRLLPELADRNVLKRIDAPLDETVPACRPITVGDLLTFRMGFGLVMAPPGTYPIQRAVDERDLAQGPPSPGTPPEPDEWMRRLGELPLMHQPGEKWLYNTGADVLGVLIARASGQPLEAFLQERLFAPLGMKDTGFSVPAGEIDRLAASYWTDYKTGALSLYDPAEGGQWSRPPAFPSGAGGLVSTVDDYRAFGQMLLNKGEYNGVRILSGPMVERMITDQLTPEQKAVSSLAPGFFDNHGWGFGLAVVTRQTGPGEPEGKFGWDGGLGTSWYSSPREDLVAILMTQGAWTAPSPPPVCRDFWTLVHQAVAD